MKMKLSLIVVAMIAATWLAVGDSPRVRSMEQRVSELEQIVVAQQSQMVALNNQVASQQWEIDRFAPLADEMEVITMSDGHKIVAFPEAELWVSGPMSQMVDLVIIGNLYHYGSIVQLP